MIILVDTVADMTGPIRAMTCMAAWVGDRGMVLLVDMEVMMGCMLTKGVRWSPMVLGVLGQNLRCGKMIVLVIIVSR